MGFTTILGLAAGTLTTVAVVPQVIKAARTRNTRDLSLAMFLTSDVGVLLWLAYGILLGEVPIIVANAVTASLLSAIVFLKLKHG